MGTAKRCTIIALFLGLLAIGGQSQPRANGNSDGNDNAATFAALVSREGQFSVTRAGQPLFAVNVGLFDRAWQQRGANAVNAAPDAADVPLESPRPFDLHAPNGTRIAGTATFAATNGATGGGIRAGWEFRPEGEVELNSLHASADFAVARLAGGRWQADERSGDFPADYGQLVLFAGEISRLRLTLVSGEWMQFDFADRTAVLLQDNRQWGPTFSIRIHRRTPDGQSWGSDDRIRLGFTLTAEGGISAGSERPVILAANENWIPLNLNLDIEAGSALDFSGMGFCDAPAGKHGFLVADDAGKFVFERDRRTPRKFYGINLCYGANYVSPERADRLAERLARLGYNAVRIHHFEDRLAEGGNDSLAFNAARFEQLDYLLAAFFKRGIYVKTDIYISRAVRRAELGLPGGGAVEMDTFKIMVPVHDRAWQNWRQFARQFLTHTNPHTGRTYADEPGLAWLSLINEGNLKNFFGRIRDIPEWRTAWNRWLQETYRTRDALAAAWGRELRDSEDPANANVRLPDNLGGATVRVRDCIRCLSAIEKDFAERATKFLRDELGVKALITNMNGWTNHVTDQAARAGFDFVDDHFYVDHPEFLQSPWRLPSRCDNQSPVADGAPGGRHICFRRLLDRPFTLSEFNYSAPGRYRGVGGILTGALGAVQDWDAIWRFAYSHDAEAMFAPARLDYFNMATDPLGQATERATMCLFLRGDLRPAEHTLSIAMTPADLAAPPATVPGSTAPWSWAAWLAKLGTRVVENPREKIADAATLPLGWATPASEFRGANTAAIAPYSATDAEILALLKERKVIGRDNRTDPVRGVFHNGTGEILIDAPRNTLVIDTAKTAGGFAPAGGHIEAADGGLRAEIAGCEATVWVSSLDDAPIARSSRLLVTHLTDVQNTGIHYADTARQTLLAWGQLPHLARAGTANVKIKLANARRFKVYALGTNGRRLAEIPCAVRGSVLEFTADVAALAAEHGAILCYEIAR